MFSQIVKSYLTMLLTDVMVHLPNVITICVRLSIFITKFFHVPPCMARNVRVCYY